MTQATIRPLINITRGERLILFQSTANIRTNLTIIPEKVEPDGGAEIFKDSRHHDTWCYRNVLRIYSPP